MKTIVSTYKDRYIFEIKNNKGNLIFSSLFDYFIVPLVKSTYKYSWKACSDAYRLARKKSYHLAAMEDMGERVVVDISAEERLTMHYLSVYDGLEDKARSTRKNKKEADKVYDEIKMVITELSTIEKTLTEKKEKAKFSKIKSRFEKLRNEYFPGRRKRDREKELKNIEPQTPPQNSMQAVASVLSKINVDDDAVEDLMFQYADSACEAIQDYHRKMVYRIDGDAINIYENGEDENPIIKIILNDRLHVIHIVPVGDLARVCPYHSPEFYQRYWKPIVENIGHFCNDDTGIIIFPYMDEIPDVPAGEHRFNLKGWNSKKYKDDHIDISFRGKEMAWIIEPSKSQRLAQKNVSKYTEQDYLNAVVKCIDLQLKSIYGRTGEVIQVIPHEDFVEVDVDFGEGLGIQRLSEDRLEIIVV